MRRALGGLNWESGSDLFKHVLISFLWGFQRSSNQFCKTYFLGWSNFRFKVFIKCKALCEFEIYWVLTYLEFLGKHTQIYFTRGLCVENLNSSTWSLKSSDSAWRGSYCVELRKIDDTMLSKWQLSFHIEYQVAFFFRNMYVMGRIGGKKLY